MLAACQLKIVETGHERSHRSLRESREASAPRSLAGSQHWRSRLSPKRHSLIPVKANLPAGYLFFPQAA